MIRGRRGQEEVRWDEMMRGGKGHRSEKKSWEKVEGRRRSWMMGRDRTWKGMMGGKETMVGFRRESGI